MNCSQILSLSNTLLLLSVEEVCPIQSDFQKYLSPKDVKAAKVLSLFSGVDKPERSLKEMQEDGYVFTDRMQQKMISPFSFQQTTYRCTSASRVCY